jgi:hypothetical protein
MKDPRPIIGNGRGLMAMAHASGGVEICTQDHGASVTVGGAAVPFTQSGDVVRFSADATASVAFAIGP